MYAYILLSVAVSNELLIADVSHRTVCNLVFRTGLKETLEELQTDRLPALLWALNIPAFPLRHLGNNFAEPSATSSLITNRQIMAELGVRVKEGWYCLYPLHHSHDFQCCQHQFRDKRAYYTHSTSTVTEEPPHSPDLTSPAARSYFFIRLRLRKLGR